MVSKTCFLGINAARMHNTYVLKKAVNRKDAIKCDGLDKPVLIEKRKEKKKRKKNGKENGKEKKVLVKEASNKIDRKTTKKKYNRVFDCFQIWIKK